ncbi:EAL domain-containing protein [Rhizobium halophytocola]|uniref:Diguanylate cyclase (GGDEF)-like protein n=1 Tax=Rhizobium halophytocola TaxID=735519 RepID=A0ABS4DV13_9HYPH|nr:EAL domain-containing protein [Rhizobium halophytocola]MBP1849536.1 diguanylate cyclase (GGDEF)-like protein [Rhizobium halophytocola]
MSRGAAHAGLRWYRSIYGKISLFLFCGIVVAYGLGALAGWTLVERSLTDSWMRQARLNAQVASFTIRSIYTDIAITADQTGQVTGIVSESPIGDDDSVLATGFNPADVLALAANQTKNPVWLFAPAEDDARSTERRIVSIASSNGTNDHLRIVFPDNMPSSKFYVGLAQIGDQQHFIASLPVKTGSGRLLGLLVSSIGTADEIFSQKDQVITRSLLVLAAVLMVIGFIVTIGMRKFFGPVPVLISMLKRIAADDTGRVTPYQHRRDEIGDLAQAIETLREAVVERENLREVRQVAREMEHLAHHDSLTGLPNRALFNLKLEQAQAKLKASGARFNIMLIDLDRFKAVNDRLGHAVGDELLNAVTARLSLVLDSHDTLARFGGDEFALLQPVKRNPMLEASRLAGLIVESLSAPFAIGGNSVDIGASVGVACAPLHGADLSELMKHADVALYGAKAAGRGRFRLYREGMVMADTNPYALMKDLEGAIGGGQFELHYQPIFSLTDDRQTGYEALLRWKHPERGMIPPDHFIPLAEECGQILELGKWVIERACRDAATMEPALSVAINVSPLQLKSMEIVDVLRRSLERHGLEPKRIEIEITETAGISSAEVIAVLKAMRKLGLSISVDDFGTGYSSLSYLTMLPVNKLKIDRSFVHDLENRHECRALIAGIVHTATSLNLKTVAEGVEDEVQLNLLKMCGCNFAQGYHLGKPRPLSANAGIRHLSKAG